MNIQGVRVQDDIGHSVVASFYAAFSLAGLVGAILASLAAELDAVARRCSSRSSPSCTIPFQLLVGRLLLPGPPARAEVVARREGRTSTGAR